MSNPKYCGVINETTAIKTKNITETYEWDFILPPTQELFQTLNSFERLCISDLKFSYGILADTNHDLAFELTKTGDGKLIRINFHLPRKTDKFEYTLLSSNMKIINDNDGVRKFGRFTRSGCSCSREQDVHYRNYGVLADDFFHNSTGLKRDKKIIRIEMVISCVFPAVCETFAKGGEITMNMHAVKAKQLDASKFFENPFLSDVVIECRGVKFHAHKIILSCNSPVFDCMFGHATMMKEAVEGRVEINDMDPSTMKEMLRFIYTGDASEITNTAELLIAAEKYFLPVLKQACEIKLIATLTLNNALEMFSLGERHGAKILAAKAKWMMKPARNKKELFADAKMLKAYSIEHPELVFELFNAD